MANIGKLTIDLPDDAEHGRASENIFVEGLGHDRYRLQSTPFFATGLSYRDIVIARKRGSQLVFEKLLFIGGHSSYRIRPSDHAGQRAFRTYWTPLRDLGCTYDEGNFGYLLYAVDIPPDTDIATARALLEAGTAAGVWEVEEGAVGHLVVKS
ncbi:DUF4265 domain-containing protein [Thalassovita mangrovi]|uniref:DUF4265 domain-containing protein n=1 Tax=Thalassovita mangrovi TaxID=2692236 RepID=A0A6L8LM69_9RHOB|nr:DUF4265 domain-containing protein [Thalassovita mangrovi]MYM57137.1 DUF4265 domain-containing protein [Thalassovita mangrovi]